MNSRQFGAKPSSSDIDRYRKSPNWSDGKFVNIEETSMSISPWKIPEIMYKQFKARSQRQPDVPLDVVPLDLDNLMAPSEKAKFVWYGHSVILMNINGKTVLIDPMLGPDASPIGPVRTRRFSDNTIDLIDDLPEIDLMLITHDHYDHLDLHSIERLKSKTKQYYVGLGAKRHLVKWGVDPEDIIEFDWWDEASFNDIHITFTPSRHFSGRGLTDRAKCLWGGWVFKTATENIWFSGDGGYGNHFKEIGKKFGPFDFAFMECGQYNENWAQIHMFPEESVQAALDAGVNKAMPVHWGAFTLAPHHWTDPAERFMLAAIEKKLHFTLPRLGEVFMADRSRAARWWLD